MQISPGRERAGVCQFAPNRPRTRASKPDMLNVALVIPSLCYGGAERQVVEIARNLDKSRFQVFIVLLTDFTPMLADDDPIRECIRIVGRRSRPDIGLVFRLARVFRELDVQVAHGFLFLAELSARIAGPLANTRVVIGSERNSSYNPATYRRLLFKVTSGLVDRIVANSKAGAKFNAELYGLSDNRYRVVYNGVDTNRFRPRDSLQAKERLGIAPDSRVIGMFGGFKRQKNHILLFRAIERCAARSRYQVVLLLVGDTLFADHDDTVAYKREILDALEQLGLRSMTLVLGNRTDIEEIYPACDITVLPSLHEGTPNVVLESMASGVPPIVSDVSDNSQLVSDGIDGYLVRLDDVDSLSTRIDELLDSEATRTRLGIKARETAEVRFSMAAMSENMSAVYLDALGEKLE